MRVCLLSNVNVTRDASFWKYQFLTLAYASISRPLNRRNRAPQPDYTPLALSRSAFYEWKNKQLHWGHTNREALAIRVREIFVEHRRRYGARRIVHELRSIGVTCSRSKVSKIMGEMDLVAIQPRSFKPKTTSSRHRLGYSPNLLLSGIELTRIDHVWVGDITYIPLRNGFAYLSTLMDLFSRKIVGWSLELTMTEELVMATLKKAIASRQPSPSLVHHTDRGGQYASKKYRALLSRGQMQQSMSRAGDCYDNAFMESCFGTMKTELEMSGFDTCEHAHQEIREYINYYNSIRRHSSLEYQSPTNFELSLLN